MKEINLSGNNIGERGMNFITEFMLENVDIKMLVGTCCSHLHVQQSLKCCRINSQITHRRGGNSFLFEV